MTEIYCIGLTLIAIAIYILQRSWIKKSYRVGFDEGYDTVLKTLSKSKLPFRVMML